MGTQHGHSIWVATGSEQQRFGTNIEREEFAERTEGTAAEDNRPVFYLLNMGSEILIDDECESSFYERRQERWTRVMQ